MTSTGGSMLDHAGWREKISAPPNSPAMTTLIAGGKIMINIAVTTQPNRTGSLLVRERLKKGSKSNAMPHANHS